MTDDERDAFVQRALVDAALRDAMAEQARTIPRLRAATAAGPTTSRRRP